MEWTPRSAATPRLCPGPTPGGEELRAPPDAPLRSRRTKEDAAKGLRGHPGPGPPLVPPARTLRPPHGTLPTPPRPPPLPQSPPWPRCFFSLFLSGSFKTARGRPAGKAGQKGWGRTAGPPARGWGAPGPGSALPDGCVPGPRWRSVLPCPWPRLQTVTHSPTGQVRLCVCFCSMDTETSSRPEGRQRQPTHRPSGVKRVFPVPGA